MQNPYDAKTAEWAHWVEEAQKQEAEHKPRTTMSTEDFMPGYTAQICIRKVARGTNSFDSHLARAVIANTKTARFVFDTGEWKRTHLVRKALDKAKAELLEVAGKP